MKVNSLEIPDVLVIDLDLFRDDRGYFVERFNKKKFSECHLPTEFVQDNFSKSDGNVLRGLHFQTGKSAQGKLVTVLKGCVLDVAVDLRAKSKTFGKWVSIELSADIPQWVWIPKGFAHGFCVTSEEGAEVLYKVDAGYDPKSESGIIWNDPALAIKWPIAHPLLSKKDALLPTLNSSDRNAWGF